MCTLNYIFETHNYGTIVFQELKREKDGSLAVVKSKKRERCMTRLPDDEPLPKMAQPIVKKVIASLKSLETYLQLGKEFKFNGRKYSNLWKGIK